MTRQQTGRPSPRLAPAIRTAYAVALTLLAACQPTADRAASTPPAPSHAGTVDPRMAGELERASERGNICSAREAKAAGLTAEYFSGTGFTGVTLLTRQEGPIDMAWPTVADDVKAPVRSARWRGWIRPPFTGSFSFHVDLPGAEITVAGKRLTAEVDKVDLNAGRYHPIQIELRDLPAAGKGAAEPHAPLKLSWTTPFGARYLLPKAVLFPPSDTVEGTAPALQTTAKRAGS